MMASLVHLAIAQAAVVPVAPSGSASNYECQGFNARGGQVVMRVSLGGKAERRTLGLEASGIFAQTILAGAAQFVEVAGKDTFPRFERFNVRLDGEPLRARFTHRSPSLMTFDLYPGTRSQSFGPAVAGICRLSSSAKSVAPAPADHDFPAPNDGAMVAPTQVTRDWTVRCRMLDDGLRKSEATLSVQQDGNVRFQPSNGAAMRTEKAILLMGFQNRDGAAQHAYIPMKGGGSSATMEMFSRSGVAWLDMSATGTKGNTVWLRGWCAAASDTEGLAK